jgi:Pentapeptide repeats (8 copies)
MKRTSWLLGAACVGTVAFLITGAIFRWPWAGFNKPLYDWMQLLIIPVVLALIAVWFNRIDKKNELAIAQKRADDEHALAIDNQQEAALQGYLDRMQDLLLHEKLRESKPGDEVRNVARVRTLTMFFQLNTRRTNYLLSFLRESGLVSKDASQSIITFNKADLRHADLHQAALYELDLSGADLSEADLSGANLSGAPISGANLSGANLSGAELKGTFGITIEELEKQTKLLQGATMPDGSKHP